MRVLHEKWIGKLESTLVHTKKKIKYKPNVFFLILNSDDFELDWIDQLRRCTK